MDLITYAGYQQLGYTDASEAEVKQYAGKASRAVAAITDYFYEDHAIDQDPWEARVTGYKKAICEQIDFIKATGIGASYEGDNYKSISIGRLSLTPDGDAKSDSLINGVCKEAYTLLAHYGLIYRGRGSVDYVATHS